MALPIELTMKNRSSRRIFAIFLFCFCITAVNCENESNVKNEAQPDYGTELIEQGRTFVHGTLKRFMIIAPAIFFKLGIAFTLLLLVTLVAVNNGFIGFLILVVGLSSVLARLQQSSSAPLVQHVPLPYASVHSLPHVAHHPWIDRSDSGDMIRKPMRSGFLGQPGYDSNSDLRNTGVYYRNSLSSAKAV